MKTTLITGITGQDGSYLAELLLEKGYDVHGTIRRSSVDFRERIAHLEGHPNFHLHYADLGDSMSILQVVKKVKPNEIYNLAAQSHVQVSFECEFDHQTAWSRHYVAQSRGIGQKKSTGTGGTGRKYSSQKSWIVRFIFSSNFFAREHAGCSIARTKARIGF